MSLTVSEVRLGNSEITGCTTSFLRKDEEKISPFEQRMSAIVQGSFFGLQQLSGLVPSSIFEPEIAAIAAASGFGAGVAVGLAWGIYKNKNIRCQSYAKEWYYWSMTWAAQKPCTRAIINGVQAVGVAVNCVYSTVQPKVGAIGNGAVTGFSAGYYAARFASDQIIPPTAVYQSSSHADETQLFLRV